MTQTYPSENMQLLYTSGKGEFVNEHHFELRIYNEGDYVTDGCLVVKDTPTVVIEISMKNFNEFVHDAIDMAVKMNAWKVK